MYLFYRNYTKEREKNQSNSNIKEFANVIDIQKLFIQKTFSTDLLASASNFFKAGVSFDSFRAPFSCLALKKVYIYQTENDFKISMTSGLRKFFAFGIAKEMFGSALRPNSA
ncbi:hypothetical protein BpHYR1_018172 [Brachionus plicatilis]|uniref:Uncharacterized protein n=1 Tax=Brachionus plicatilis TaxID=10195 RepID=A0A3M7SH21_BRAPC|nr:hypothetical protein BpHYR1_018172 [Brachionus plicatilis]